MLRTLWNPTLYDLYFDMTQSLPEDRVSGRVNMEKEREACCRIPDPVCGYSTQDLNLVLTPYGTAATVYHQCLSCGCCPHAG